MIKTPMITFLGLNTLAFCVLLAGTFVLVLFALSIPVYSFTRSNGIGYTCSSILTSTHFAGLGLYMPPMFVLNFPSTISPALKTLIVVAGVTTPCLLVSSGVPIVYGAVKIYFAISLNFKVKLRAKIRNIFDFYKIYYIRCFTAFYKFEKFAVRGLFYFKQQPMFYNGRG